MIKLQVIGHLGKDAIVNNVNGKSVINFNVAHSEKFKDAQGQQKDKTTWVECAYWTDRTAVAPYLKKGQLVFAEGTPEVRTYTTKEGTPGASLSMRLNSVQLLGSRTEQGGENAPPSSYQNAQPSYNSSYNQSSAPAAVAANDTSEPSDDLPF